MQPVLGTLGRLELPSALLLGLLLLPLRNLGSPDDEMAGTVAIDFEVFGRVQGVFFRKYTQSRAKDLGLRGWCRNTREGTVLGYMEGDKSKVEEMKNWLRNTGSPQSAIDKAEFRNEKQLDAPTLDSFSIKK